MPAALDLVHPEAPPRVLIVVSDPADAPDGQPYGFWWSEVTHAYWEFAEAGYTVDFASPGGGMTRADAYSDPRDRSGYSANDLISLGFLGRDDLVRAVTAPLALGDVELERYDVLYVAGGQAPLLTFPGNVVLHAAITRHWSSGRVLCVVCHGTIALLDARDDAGELIVAARTWTGFAASEERQWGEPPAWRTIIEDRARAIAGTNFITRGRWKPFAVRDGRLITGQQQYSAALAAREVIAAVGR
jgi:putative intracellular protease/amidase